jgi:hypothetical protein
VGSGRTLLIVVTFKMLLLFVGVGETLISGGLGQLSLAVSEFRVNQAAYDPDEGYVYFEFEFDEAFVEVVTNRPNAWRDRLASGGSKTVAQEFGEGLPEIGERQHAGELLINRDDRNDIESTQPLPTIPLPRRSLQCASLPLASFEAPLSCLRAHPKHQGLRRSARAAESPSRYNRSAAHRSR